MAAGVDAALRPGVSAADDRDMVSRRAVAPLLLGLLAPAPAAAATGGAAPPEASGGVSAGHPVRHAPPRVAALVVSPARLTTAGGDVTLAFRVDAAARTVRAAAVLTRRGTPGPAVRTTLGAVRTRRRVTRTLRLPGGRLAAGRHVVALVATDAAGRTARASAALTVVAPAPAPVPAAPAPVAAPASAAGVFPVQGPWTFGGDGSRFGAPRTSHIHQGQDIAAPAGTPVVAPEAGTVVHVGFQAAGAGHYAVLRTTAGRDMVFMHLQYGSIAVPAGTPVTAGQLIGRVGATGTASGPHLHFELWPDGWRTSPDAHPVDPLPDLLAWAGTR